MFLRVLAAGGLLGLILTAQPVHAWAPAGHKIAASIAYRLMSPERRTELARILERHPRFEQDFREKIPNHLPAGELQEWHFQQASIWPDMVRSLPPQLKDLYHHGSWHYCNRPLFLTEADRMAMEPHLTVNLITRVPVEEADRQTMNVLQALEYNRSVAFDRRADPAARAMALCWVIHLTGDIHQPLHSCSMFSQQYFPSLLEGDRGGNSVLTKQGERLHGLWDNFPGGDIKFATAKQRAVKFMDDPELQLIAMNAIQVVSIKAWFDESHALARDFAYNEEVTTFLKQLDPKLELDDRPKLVLTPEYLKTGGLIARERVVIAGYRLGHLLK